MTWGAALEDCEHCLQLDPHFFKAYTRRGRIQHAMKEYHKALESFQAALKIDPGNEDAKEAMMLTRAAIAEV
jgi:stress-induced-phosphoprotein 1